MIDTERRDYGRIEAPLRGQWKPIRRAPMYHLALAGAGAATLLIPLAYLSLIGLVAWGMWWHIANNTSWAGSVEEPRDDSTGDGAAEVLVKSAAYVMPIFAGTIGLIALLRPLTPRSRGEREIIQVYPSEESRLFQFVEMVATVVGSPPPKRIEIDCNVNASAGFRGGVLSLFRPGDLVLKIGMPLAAGLNKRQFAAVLAHEFGHFNQGVGMRAYWVIGKVNGWLARVAYPDDGRGPGLDSMSMSSSWTDRTISEISRVFEWVSRRLCLALLSASHALNCVMSRQMEYDADRHGARFVGSEAAAGLSRRMMELSEGLPPAMDEVRMSVARNQAPDDVASLIADHADTLSADAAARVKAALRSREERWLDAHPAMGKRVAAILATQEPGLYVDEAPARELFTDFRAIAIRATYLHYRAGLGEGVFDLAFIPTPELLNGRTQALRGKNLVAEYLGCEFPDWRPLFPAGQELNGVEDPRRAFEALRELKRGLAEASHRAREWSEEFCDADLTLARVAEARGLFSMGVTRTPKTLRSPITSAPDAETIVERASEDLARSALGLGPIEEMASRRLNIALRLLHTRGIERRLDEVDQMRERSLALWAAATTMREVFFRVNDARRKLDTASGILAAWEARPRLAEKVKAAARKLSRGLHQELGEIRARAGGTACPFEDPRGRVNLGERLVGATPADTDFAEVFGVARGMVTRYAADQSRIISELVLIASRVEAGLRPREAAETDSLR